MTNPIIHPIPNPDEIIPLRLLVLEGGVVLVVQEVAVVLVEGLVGELVFRVDSDALVELVT